MDGLLTDMFEMITSFLSPLSSSAAFPILGKGFVGKRVCKQKNVFFAVSNGRVFFVLTKDLNFYNGVITWKSIILGLM